jgi:hypothetical protein
MSDPISNPPVSPETPRQCPNPHCVEGRIRGTPGVGCSVCDDAGRGVAAREGIKRFRRPVRINVDQDAFFEAIMKEPDLDFTTGSPNYERDAAAVRATPLPAKEETSQRLATSEEWAEHERAILRSSQPSSSSEITEALNELEESAFDRGELRHGDPTEKAAWERARAARSRLESLYLEQREEAVRGFAEFLATTASPKGTAPAGEATGVRNRISRY